MTDMPATSSIEATSGAAQTPFKDWYLAGGGPVYSITFADGSVWRADTGWQVWRETKRSPASGPSHEPKSNKGFIEMTATASLKQKVTLEERVIALMDELDAALDELAEQKRPKGRLSSDTPDGLPAIVGALPAGSMRVEFDLRARKQFPGECLCKSYHAAIKT